jgi:serine phosphatase RsbU (regulator of sigma subunit)
MALPAGWRLFFYTDGLIEGRAAPGSPERFGESRLIKAVQRLDGGVVDGESLDRLLADVEAVAGEPFADDVAVILISQAPAPAPASHGGAATAADARP